MGTVKPEVLFACPHMARIAKLDLDGQLQAMKRQIEGAKSELQRVLDHLESVKHDFKTFLTRHLALVDETRPSLNSAGQGKENVS